MKLRRKIDGLLAEGRGSQLLWLILILAASFLVFCGISKFIFQDGTFSWQDILALYLDPGVFGGAGKHDWFRLLITLFGAFFFAAMLISVISNIFENISESYTKGETRYHFDNHILFLGANFMLLGMLQKLHDEWKDNKLGGRHIVIMTTRSVEELRDIVESRFPEKNWLKNLTFYYDRRDIQEKLKAANADKASCIYVLGEDNEPNHDNNNLCCLNGLRSICNNSETHCYVLMENQVTMRSFQHSKNETTCALIKVDIINIYEHLAYEVLCHYPNSVKDDLSINHYYSEDTIIHYGISCNTNQYVHIVIIGLTEIGHAISKISACLCHYPKRTKITIVEPDLKKVEEFVSFYPNMFSASKTTRVFEDKNGKSVTQSEENVSDIDIEWEFILYSPTSSFVRRQISQWADNFHSESLSLIICEEDSNKNISLALTLPSSIFSRNIPVFVYVASQHNLLENVNNKNLVVFGYTDNWVLPTVSETSDNTTGTTKDEDLFFGERTLKAKKMAENINKEWGDLSEKDRQRFLYRSLVLPLISQEKVDNSVGEQIHERCERVINLLMESEPSSNEITYDQLISNFHTNEYTGITDVCNPLDFERKFKIYQDQLIKKLSHEGTTITWEDISKLVNLSFQDGYGGSLLSIGLFNAIEKVLSENPSRIKGEIPDYMIDSLAAMFESAYEVFDDVANEIDTFDRLGPDLRNKAKSLIECLANAGNGYACYTMAYLNWSNKPDLRKWYKKGRETSAKMPKELEHRINATRR